MSGTPKGEGEGVGGGCFLGYRYQSDLFFVFSSFFFCRKDADDICDHRSSESPLALLQAELESERN